MENNQSEQPQKIFSTDEDKGALFQTVQTRRKVKIYAVTESELTTISFLNTLAIVLFSVGSMCFTIGMTIVLDYMMSELPIPVQMIYSLKWIAIPSLIASIIFIVFGIVSIYQRKSNLEKIQSESDTS